MNPRQIDVALQPPMPTMTLGATGLTGAETPTRVAAVATPRPSSHTGTGFRARSRDWTDLAPHERVVDGSPTEISCRHLLPAAVRPCRRKPGRNAARA